MQEVIIEDKLEYLNEHYPFKPIPMLSEQRQCVQCNTIFLIADYKVFKTEKEELICCPNYAECGGTVLDWIRVF